MERDLEINGERIDDNYGAGRSNKWLNMFGDNKWSTLNDLRHVLNELNELSKTIFDETLFLAISCICKIIVNHFILEQNPYRGRDIDMLTDEQMDNVMDHMNIEADDDNDDAAPFSYLCDYFTNDADPTYWTDAWRVTCITGNVRVPDGQTKDAQTWISHQKNLIEKMKPRVAKAMIEMADQCDDVINSQAIRISY